MLHFHYNPDDYVSESETRVCPFHQKYPMVRLDECGCTVHYLLRKATPAERESNRTRREQEERERDQALRDFGM